jgi:hypothetical protein
MIMIIEGKALSLPQRGREREVLPPIGNTYMYTSLIGKLEKLIHTLELKFC